MQILFISFAVLGILYVLFSSMQKGFHLFIIVLFCCSHIWTVSVSSIDFTIYRIILLSILIKYIIIKNTNNELLGMDLLVILYFISRIVSLQENVPWAVLLEREMGRILDVGIPYLLTRSLIRDVDTIYTVFLLLVKIALFMVFFSVLQSYSGINLLGPPTSLQRYGFYRSNLVFGDYISCGLFFTINIVLCYGLYIVNRLTKKQVVFYSITLMIGVLSTLSTAPLFSLIASFVIIQMYRYKNLMALFVGLFVLFLVFVELYSNRHFYEIFTDFSFNSQSSYYRIGLMNEAFGGGMDGHWWKGFGYVGVGQGNDNTSFHWKHKDLVNLYIANLVRYGLIGLIPFLAINISFYYSVLTTKFAYPMQKQKFVWILFSGMVGWNIAMLTVNAMGQIETLLFIFIAIVINIKQISQRKDIGLSLPYTNKSWRYGYA